MEEFQELLAEVTESMEARKWEKAREALLEGLVAHEGRAYALARRKEIEEMVRRCVFWERTKAPKPKDLVSGKLKKYSEATGQMRIVYGPENLDDFEKSESRSGSLSLPTPVLLHPAAFSGKHAVEVKGSSYSTKLFILVSVDFPEAAYAINLGRVPSGRYTYPATLQRLESLEYREKDKNEDSRAVPGKPYRIKVTVDDKKVTVTYGGKKILSCEKEVGQWGSIGFMGLGQFDEITLDGRAERAWIQGLQDEAVRDLWEAFEQDFRPEGHLPGWLADGGEGSDESEPLLPDVLQARRLANRGSLPEAIELLQGVVAENPDLGPVWGDLAWLCLLDGRVDEARSAVREAHMRGLSAGSLDQSSRALVKLDAGPAWSNAFEWESEHYRVASDIDKRTCKDAADVLEAAYRLYRRELGPVEDSDELFPVYLFSGKAGYLSYTEDLGANLDSSMGAFFTALRQLVIWNAPQREDMLRTVRHEGLHQYLDSMVSGAPKWLHEGLAEYFEAAERDGTRWIIDGVHAVNHLILKKYGTFQLEEFLAFDDGEFMKKAGSCYPQAWAFVHFLRHGPLAEEDLVGAYLDALKETGSREAAHSRVFGGRNMEALDAAFRAYIQSLR